jgi:hypothetical protein
MADSRTLSSLSVYCQVKKYALDDFEFLAGRRRAVPVYDFKQRHVLCNKLVDSLTRTVIKISHEFFQLGTIYNKTIACFSQNGGLCFLKSI